MHQELEILLQRRIDLIADHAFRDRDAASHLQALKEVSEEILAYSNKHQQKFDAKLRHYLAQCSYQKALAHLSEARSSAASSV